MAIEDAAIEDAAIPDGPHSEPEMRPLPLDSPDPPRLPRAVLETIAGEQA